MERSNFLEILIKDLDKLPEQVKNPKGKEHLRRIWNSIKALLEADDPLKSSSSYEQYERVVRLLIEAHRTWSRDLRDILLQPMYCAEKREWAMMNAENEHDAVMILMRRTLSTWSTFNGD
ncbi:MAG TPA: hypothetical protein P5077_02230 [bacterium]|nr:hypothetical protein [bacterium]